MHIAISEFSGTAVQPEIPVPLEVKLTVPVGIGGPEGLTVAVRVTSCPTSDGFGVLVTTVAVKPVRLKTEPSPVLPPDSVVP
jgi:hypothetical protein